MFAISPLVVFCRCASTQTPEAVLNVAVFSSVVGILYGLWPCGDNRELPLKSVHTDAIADLRVGI